MSKKIIILIIAIVLLILIVIGAIFYFNSNKGKSPSVNNSSVLQQNAKNPAVQKIDPLNTPANNIQSSQPILKRDVLPNETVPSILASYTKDVSQGYNLKITTTEFNFVPENKSEDFGPNNGYVKLYVNNVFNTRIYSSDYYLRFLKPGKYNVRVELSDTNGRTLFSNQKIIDSVVDIEVK
jgi:hypothetical protein